MKSYLIFCLDGTFYGINISTIQEIVELMPMSRLPQGPGYVLGVISVHNHFVTVIDLRSKFNLPKAESSINSSIIILEFLDENHKKNAIGVLVDEIVRVEMVSEQQYVDLPSLQSGQERYLSEAVELDLGVVFLIDVKALLFKDGDIVGIDPNKAVIDE